MKGAIVFLAAFLLFLLISLGYPGLPPGRQIYDAAIGEESDYNKWHSSHTAGYRHL